MQLLLRLFFPLFLCSLVAAMAPPLPPTPIGTYLTGHPTTPPTINVECYIDLVCPFSAKMFMTLYREVVPAIRAKQQSSKIAIKIHHVVQPWHPQGTLVHEAALAAKKVLKNDDEYFAYFDSLCKDFTGPDKKFSDADTWSKSRNEIYEDLLQPFRNDPRGENIRKLLVPETLEGNCGNGVTQDVKWACKHHRAMGVHVTPTVFVNGIEAVQISSGWTAEDWTSFFDGMLEA